MNICVIGAGASGIIAAIEAAKNGNKITIIEKNSKPLKKVSISGNGKCNFTNSNIEALYYQNDAPEFIENTFNQFSNRELISYFNKIGIIETCNKGLYYPLSNKSESIISVLLKELKKYDINIIYNAEVNSVLPKDNDIEIHFNDIENNKKEIMTFNRVIISCGSPASFEKDTKTLEYMLREINPNIVPFSPALCGYYCQNNISECNGIRSTVILNFEDHYERGELQFNEKGISGVCVFQLSYLINNRLSNENVNLYVDFIPDKTEEELIAWIEKRIMDSNVNETSSDFFMGILPVQLMNHILSICESPKYINECTKKDIYKIISTIKNYCFILTKSYGFKNAQACTGGVSLKEINKDFSLKKNPNIFITGEALNVAGICGGYNLQWAFSSGYIAGINQK